MNVNFTKKEQAVILIVVTIIISVLGFKFIYGKVIGKEKEEVVFDSSLEEGIDDELEELKETSKSLEENFEEEFQGKVMVHISGQVENPGIVELDYGKRLIDAVESLGGLTLEADMDRINLAKKLQDEEKIYIPKVGEVLDETTLDIINSSATGVEDEISEKNSNTLDTIDINFCSKEELCSSPGIGDVISTRILEYREENMFKSIEDIMNVSGIGDKKFEGIKELIRVKWGNKNEQKINRTYKNFRLSG